MRIASPESEEIEKIDSHGNGFLSIEADNDSEGFSVKNPAQAPIYCHQILCMVEMVKNSPNQRTVEYNQNPK
ncbi:hypothetical protein ACLOJK_014021 [Asimina triloba]